MNLYFRLLFLLAKRLILRSPAQNIFQECQTTFWVNPLDLDVNLHMNNGRFLSLMDLARVDLMIKSKIFWKLFLEGYYPVVASESIRFKKSLMPFQFFKIKTQIESWDDKDFFIKQTFVVKNEIYAVGYIKGRFKKRGVKNSISTPDLFSAVDIPWVNPSLTELALTQKITEKLLFQNFGPDKN